MKRELIQLLKKETQLDDVAIGVIVGSTLKYYQHIIFFTSGLKQKAFSKKLIDSIVFALSEKDK